MKILAIVGSEALEGSAEAKRIIERALDEHQPGKVVSGGARGIDTMAETAALRRGIEFERFLPRTRRWRDGFMPRNLQIATACTHLIRIVVPDSKTYGSGWTRDRAAGMGKPTFEYVVAP